MDYLESLRVRKKWKLAERKKLDSEINTINLMIAEEVERIEIKNRQIVTDIRNEAEGDRCAV